MTNKDTSWNNVADWYHDHLNDSDTYHQKVILPNLLRMMDLKKTDKVAELGCGQGFFISQIANAVQECVGIDLAPELIAIAEKNKTAKNLEYKVASADNTNLPENYFDKVLIILAIQNMKNLNEVVAEVSRILKPKGQAFIVLNHPAFRIVGHSAWRFDEEKNIQLREIDAYMTEMSSKIDMHPGQKEKEVTYSFHRPLQVYFKAFNKNGLTVSRLEEWISHKKSEKGKRQVAENTARKEFPLFMALELIKV